LVANYGTNQGAPVLNDVYQNLRNQLSMTLGLSVPVFSAGAYSANIKIANYKMQNQQLQQQQLDQQVIPLLNPDCSL